MAAETYAQLEALWIAAGGSPLLAPTMAAIALAESTGVANKVNPVDNNGKQSSFGLWQISNGTHDPPDPNWADPATNARLAVGKLRTQGLGAWGTYTSGAYRQYLSFGVPPATLPAASASLPPGSHGKPGAPPKATLAVVNAPAPTGDVQEVKAHAMGSWNLLVNQLFYWVPNGLNRSRRARAGMRALIR